MLGSKKVAKSAPSIKDVPADAELSKAIAQTSPECIKVVAADGRLLQMNPSGLAMIEADCWESVAHASYSSSIAPSIRDLWLANHQRVCDGEALVWEFDIVGLKGTRRSMETHASPIRLGDGSTGTACHHARRDGAESIARCTARAATPNWKRR